MSDYLSNKISESVCLRIEEGQPWLYSPLDISNIQADVVDGVENGNDRGWT